MAYSYFDQQKFSSRTYISIAQLVVAQVQVIAAVIIDVGH